MHILGLLKPKLTRRWLVWFNDERKITLKQRKSYLQIFKNVAESLIRSDNSRGAHQNWHSSFVDYPVQITASNYLPPFRAAQPQTFSNEQVIFVHVFIFIVAHSTCTVELDTRS